MSKDLTADPGPHVTSEPPWSTARVTFHLRCINEAVLPNRIYFLERGQVSFIEQLILQSGIQSPRWAPW